MNSIKFFLTKNIPIFIKNNILISISKYISLIILNNWSIRKIEIEYSTLNIPILKPISQI